MITKISQLYDVANKKSKKKLILAAAHDENALEAVVKAYKKGIIEPILVGNEKKMEKIATKHSFDLTAFRVINEEDVDKAASIAVKMVHNKEADILMKGNLGTSNLLRAVLNKEWGLRTGELLSHLALFELPSYHKIFGVTDAAMNVAPDLAGKAAIIKNSVDYLARLGIFNPKVALICAVETVNEAMSATTDAALLSKMALRNQIKNCIIDGPLALDNAIDKHSAEHKGIISEVAGDADILVCPTIESANILYKSLVFFAGAQCAAVIVGASAPIVLTSRADSDETKLNSIALAATAK